MDYKMLHTGYSQVASSPSTEASGVSEVEAFGAVPQRSIDGVEAVEEGLEAVARRAPEHLVGPSLEALTSGGKRLRPLLLLLCERRETMLYRIREKCI